MSSWRRGRESDPRKRMRPGPRLRHTGDLPGQLVGEVGRLDLERMSDLALQERPDSLGTDVEAVATGADDGQERREEKSPALPVPHGRHGQVAAGVELVEHGQDERGLGS